MARRRYSARVSRETVRRKFVWARVTSAGSLGPGAIARVDALGEFNTAYGADLLGATVVRMRGVFQLNSGAWGDSAILAAMVEPEPVGTLEPEEGPIFRPFADWMMFEPFFYGNGNDGDGRVIDVKAARKLEELQEQLSIYVQTPAGNTGASDYRFYLSVGLKLP